MSAESIRKQIEKAKKDAEKILSKKDSSKDNLRLIKTLLRIIDVMTTVFLEKKIRKNSSNSGISSGQEMGGSHNNRNKKKGKKEKKRGSRLENSKTEQQTHVLSPKKCQGCGPNLKKGKVTKTEDRKHIDIAYIIKENIYTAETVICGACGKETKAEFPKGIDGPEQYGEGIKAIVIDFLVTEMISMKRTAMFLHGFLGRFISPAVMLKYIRQFSETLKKWEKWAILELLKATVVHVDETSMRVEKKNFWIHTYGAGDIVLQFIHPRRGCDAIDDIGIIPKYGGIIIHDRYSPYFTYDHLVHALCNGHLLRDLKYVEDCTGDKWATRLKRLLKSAIKMVNEKKEKILSKKEYGKLQRLYREILSGALLELPLFKESKKRDRTKMTDAQNLWTAFIEFEDAILLFAKITEVDATNNRAERDLRMNKVKKKVSGCFRNFEMAKHFCRISGYIKTMRNKGYSSLEAITMALKGDIPF